MASIQIWSAEVVKLYFSTGSAGVVARELKKKNIPMITSRNGRFFARFSAEDMRIQVDKRLFVMKYITVETLILSFRKVLRNITN